MQSLSHLKKKCAGCGKTNVPMNKEHIFPEWLIFLTNTHKTGIRWGNKLRLPALSATIPICVKCNSDFGEYLEKPVSNLFIEIENGKGVSDNEAELLIRWLWKLDGLNWIAMHPYDDYTRKYTLKERVLTPIDAIRKHLLLAISLIGEIDITDKDLPMGVDSINEIDAIFVSGVFAKIAIMSVLDNFRNQIPEEFDIYQLAEKRNKIGDMKVFFPKTGFEDGGIAVFTVISQSKFLSELHDQFAMNLEEIHKK
jgi:hypothetical protein